MAFHDGLTGLANRELFEETLVLAVERAQETESLVAVLYLDLDNFKLVNDTMGHHTGDTLLRETAERLRGCTRETDLVARQGGDEFLILLADLQPDQADDTIRSVAQRVNEAFGAPFDLHGVEVRRSRFDRDQRVPEGCPGPGRAPQERRHRDVPSQTARPGRLRVLRGRSVGVTDRPELVTERRSRSAPFRQRS